MTIVQEAFGRRRWVCLRKIRYPTKGSAKAAAKRMHHLTGAKYNVYRCEYSLPDEGPHYHIGRDNPEYHH